MPSRKRTRSSSSSESATSSSSSDSSVQQNGSDTTSPASSTTTSSSVSSEDLRRTKVKTKRKNSQKKVKRESSDSEVDDRPKIKTSKRSQKNNRSDKDKHSSKSSAAASESKTKEKKHAINILGSQRHAHKSPKYLHAVKGENDSLSKSKSSHKQQPSKQSRSAENSNSKISGEKRSKTQPENFSDAKYESEQKLPSSTETSSKNKHRSSPKIPENSCSRVLNENISPPDPNECSSGKGKDVSKNKSSKKHSAVHETPEKDEVKSANSPNFKEPSKTTEKETSQNEEKITSKTLENKYDFSDTLDKELEQNKLEEEMLKRKERIEKWRAERKLQEPNVAGVNASAGKSWTLDDDADDDDEEAPADTANDVSADAEDPLDEYMSMISKEVKLAHCEDLGQMDKGKFKVDDKEVPANENSSDSKTRKIRIVRTVVKSDYSSKGHIMEQDADGLEYSSEDDGEEEMESVFCKKSKADSIITDHEKIYYRKFRKNFYVEVPEIAKMTLEEVAAYREEMDMKIRGKNCPKPIKTWAQCITYVSVLDILRKSNFEKPTPIQAQALPLIASGRDMLGIAKTGSGKTLAFVLPMLRHIKHQPRLEADDGPIALIMTPTRELAMQISKECRKFGKALDLKVAAVYGGTGISEQIAELKRGAEIVVCTPGRMIDMIAANNGRVTNLRRITYVVLDEADRMFDLGFEPQVTKILETIRPDRQTVMFSATFPRQMEALARKALTKPVEVTVGGRSVVCGDVEQNVVVLNEDQKYLKLLELLGIYQEHGGVLVFVHKQEHADELMKNLMQNAYPCMALHGGLDQYDRDSVIADFKNGAIKLLIATSVAARGLDVKDLILVVNYDCPNHFEDYIHRCGRTGRAGNKGAAFTFITPGQERYAGDIIKALEQSGAEVNWELQQLWDNYVNKMAAEGKTVKTGGGFSGKGFKFNEEEELFSDDRKRAQKAMFNLQDSDDEDSLDIDQEIDKAFKSKTRIKETNALEAQGSNSQSFSTAEKLAFARQVAAKINLQRPDSKEFSQPSSSLFMKGNTFGMSYSSKTVAEQIAERLNNKLNYIPKEKEEISQQNEFKVYEEELEINDFPQNARWKVTSKETLTHIAEYAEAGITVRGQYFPPGKQPPMGERKLYLAIESLSERSLQLAKGEITRIIKEEMLKMQNPALQLLNRGRYKVL